MRLSPGERTLLWVASGAAGLVHLLLPGVLLRVGGWAYRWALAVEFDPKPGAKRRVRLAGLGFLLAAVVLRRLLED